MEDSKLVKPVANNRNAKRSRITALIKERAAKNKLAKIAEVVPEDQALLSAQSSIMYSDERFYFSKHIIEALNSCDMEKMEETFRKYCSPDIISDHKYTGNNPDEESLPHTVVKGLETVIAMWTAWFRISPDSVFMCKETTGSVDTDSGIVSSYTSYANHLTRVLDGSPIIPEEIVSPSDSPCTSSEEEDEDSVSHSLQSEEDALSAADIDADLALFFCDCFVNLEQDPCLSCLSADSNSSVRTVTPPAATNKKLKSLAVSSTAEKRSAFPLKQAAVKCKYDALLTVLVEGERITRMNFTFW